MANCNVFTFIFLSNSEHLFNQFENCQKLLKLKIQTIKMPSWIVISTNSCWNVPVRCWIWAMNCGFHICKCNVWKWRTIYLMSMNIFSVTKFCYLRYHIFTSLTKLQNMDLHGCILDNLWMKNEFFPQENLFILNQCLTCVTE